MKRSELVQLVKEVMLEIDEANVSGNAGAYHTPFAFGKDKRAKKVLKKQGYKEIK